MAAGFLSTDKPSGVTSRDVVNAIQRLVRPLKVGHAGTLDPLATGVLVVAVGAATRLIGYVQDGRKRYRGTFRLGQSSDTNDCTGAVVESGDPSQVSNEQLTAVLAEFVGPIVQTPPQFSAVHVQGRRAYDLARKGIDVELAPRLVEVDSIELVEFAPPEFTIDVVCGGGTYLRSIGRDIGERLGCGALMTALRRTAVGPFTLDCAAAPENITRENWEGRLLPPAFAVQHLASSVLSTEQVADVRRGQAIRVDETPQTGMDVEIALFNSEDELIGVGVVDTATGRLQPRLILAGPSQG